MRLFERFSNNEKGTKATESYDSSVAANEASAAQMADGFESPEADLWREEISRGIYLFPVPITENVFDIGKQIAYQDPPEKKVKQIGNFIVSHSPESHQNQHAQALDFLVLDGTPVLAAADGEIVDFVLGNSDYGSSEEFADRGNYITIKHSNGEFSQYYHLAYDSLHAGIKRAMRMNQRLIVRVGQQIATTGKTGWTDRDHLHFVVFRDLSPEEMGKQNPDELVQWKSLKPQFEGLEEKE